MNSTWSSKPISMARSSAAGSSFVAARRMAVAARSSISPRCTKQFRAPAMRRMARRREGVRDRGVLEAMRAVPREAFIESGFEEFAYEDGALPIGENQTISQPYIVALMIEAA